MIEVIVGNVEPLEVKKPKETGIGIDRTIKTTATEVDADHITGVLIAPNTIPCAAIAIFEPPQRNLRISRRSMRCRLNDNKAFFELQQGNDLIIMAQWLHRRIRASRYKRKQQ